jgi:aspartate-semialdehyde dehydrogenase
VNVNRGYVVAVVGATGAVGREVISILEARKFPVRELRLLASARSAGKVIDGLVVAEVTDAAFDGCDIAIFDVPDAVSKEWAPRAAARGAVAIDNAGTFRQEPDVPLVIPEINAAEIARRPRGIIANPNCTTATFLVPLAALHQAFVARRVFGASYQSVSGAGQPGIDQLWAEVRAVVDRGEPLNEPLGNAFAHPIALNIIPAVGSVRDGGHTSEEVKALAESRKILGHPTLEVGITCVRVPTLVSHGVAIHAEFDRMPSAEAAREVLRGAPGVVVVDDPRANRVPTALTSAGRDPSYVGRVRVDGAGRLAFFAVADNLRKGAALNTVQIAEALVAMEPDLSNRGAAARGPR